MSIYKRSVGQRVLSTLCLLNVGEYLAGREIRLHDLDARVVQSIFQRLGEYCRRWDGSRFTDALDAQWLERGWYFKVPQLDFGRHIGGLREEIIHEGGRQQLAGFVVVDFFIEGVADAHLDAAVNLSFHDHRVDGGAAVMHHHQPFDLGFHGFSVHIQNHGHAACAGGAVRRPVVSHGFQAGFRAGREGAAHWVSPAGQIAKRHALVRDVGHADKPSGQFQLIFRRLQDGAGQFQGFFLDLDRRKINSRSGDGGPAAGKSAGAPGKVTGISGDDLDIGDLNAQLFGHDLGEGGIVRLTLSRDTRGNAYLAVAAHRDLGTLIRPYAGTLGEAANADAEVFAFGASFGLNFLAEFLVIDHLHDFPQSRGIIAAVEHAFHEILADDAGRDRVSTRLDEVDAPDFRHIHRKT